MTSQVLKSATAGLAFGLAVFVVSEAAAQSGGTTATTGTTGTTGTVRVAGTATTGGVNASATTTGTTATAAPRVLSPADQLTVSEGIVQRGNVLSQRVSQMLDEARRETDMIRVTCLNDKLTQVNANLRTAQSRLAALQKAPDKEQRDHEYTVLSVLGQKLQVLDQEANQCVGQDLYETGPTKIVTEIDTSLMPFEDDPRTPPIMLPPSLFEAPPNASSTGT
jgi:hypothetical protein